MTDVFISYAREDQPVARMVATEVIRLGYQVWWDEDLPAHVRYGDVIAERITGAKAVIVLWSRHSVASEWVRAEADRGREARKLVQTALDPTPPPMPFNQIQVASLAGWQGQPDHPGWRRVMDSLAALAPVYGVPPPRAPGVPPGAPPPLAAAAPARGMNMTTIGVLLAALVLLVAFGIGMMMVPNPAPERPARQARRAAPPAAPPPPQAREPDGPIDFSSLVPPSRPAGRSGAPAEMLPDSSVRLLSPAELAGLSLAQLRLARNEIFARRGRIFQDPNLTRHFSRYPWYRPVAFEVQLGELEAANVRLIQAAENSR